MLYPLAPAGSRAVTLEQAKAHLRVDTSDEDELITLYLDAAIASAADHAGRAFNQTIYRQTFDHWPLGVHHAYPHGNSFELLIAPVVSIVGVAYLDTAGNSHDLKDSDFFFRAAPAGGYVVLRSTFVRPALLETGEAISIDFEAGYDPPGASEALADFVIPPQAVAAILLTTGHLFANRETVVIGRTAVPLPAGATALLDQIRIYR